MISGDCWRALFCLCRRATGWRRKAREELGLFRGCGGSEELGLGRPGGGAVFSARHGGACQAGAPRALTAALRRVAAAPQTAAAGQPDAIAILMRRTLMRTRAPIFMSLRRMVPQLALWKRV